MIAIRGLSLAGVLIMTISITVAYTTGDFFEEGSEIWYLPWGKVSLIDLYVGLFFFGAWIAYREGGGWSTAVWWLGLVVFGNLTAAIYLAYASFTSTNGHQVLSGPERPVGEVGPS